MKRSVIMEYMKCSEGSMLSVFFMIVHFVLRTDLSLQKLRQERSIFLEYHFLRQNEKMSYQHHQEFLCISFFVNFFHMQLTPMRQSSSDGMSNPFLLLIFFFLIFFTFSCQEYREFYEHEHAVYREGAYHEASWTSAILSLLPDVRVLSGVVQAFASARERIWVTVYTWTEKSTIQALIDAKNRWIDVRVLLEWNVYQTPWINTDTFKKFQEAHIDVRYADNDRYTFTHAKYWIIDESYCVSTGNLTYSAFTKNRDVILCDRIPTVLSALVEVFESDMKHIKPLFVSPIPENLLISPINMRWWIEKMVQNSRESIYIFVQSLSDHLLISLLEEKKRNGIDVRVCVWSNNDPESLSWVNFPVSISSKPYLHAKMMFFDTGTVFLGSTNLTENALDRNREIGLIYKNDTKKYNEGVKTFFMDCPALRFAK